MAEEVQRILADIFLTKVPVTSAAMLTIIRVEMSRDLRYARVFLSLLEPKTTDEDVIRDLRHHGKEIRHHLSGSLQAKYVPHLRFYLDLSLQQSAKIHALLEDLTAAKPAASG